MSAITRAWDAMWFGPVSNVRIWLMVRMSLLVLAFDAWLLMIERGGRYGAGDFNVAHFAWLDALQPVPSAAFYVGLIFTCGVLAMLLSLGFFWRLGILGLTALYTYGWSMSQLDSYQHHVFISWILLCFCCLPDIGTRAICSAPRMISAWGYRLLAAITTVLYFFTGVSKAEPEWLSGSVLKRINSADGDLEWFRQGALDLGLEELTFWTLAGHSVVAVQWLITGLWLSILIWGEGGGRWVRLGRAIGVASAIAFHVGAEVFGLRIGWFSWYMILMTLVAFVPSRPLSLAAAGLGRLGAFRSLQGLSLPTGWERALWLSLSVIGACCLMAVGFGLDLPGVETAAILWFAIALSTIIARALTGQGLRSLAFALALTGISLSMSIHEGRARYDFYRYVGGDATRRLELKDALHAYGRANTYAPEGEGRWKKVAKVKGMLRQAPTPKARP